MPPPPRPGTADYLGSLPDDIELMLPVGEETGLDRWEVRVRPEVPRLQAGRPHRLILALHPHTISPHSLFKEPSNVELSL